MPEPLCVGILHDTDARPPGRTGLRCWLQLAFDDLIASGRIDRPVAFEEAWGLGLPEGTAATVGRSFRSLAEREVLLIVGPAVGDNALVVTPLAEALRVPTINWAGTERARGDYMFHLQVGSHEDEGVVLARRALREGCRRVAVIHDRGVIGRRYLSYFLAEAAHAGLGRVASVPVPIVANGAAREVDEALASDPDGIVYLGLGLAACAVAEALSARGWTGSRLMNTAGIRGYAPDLGHAFEGWTYVDMHADDNRTLAELTMRLGIAPENRFRAASGYDLARLAAEGIARATELTREGIRDGLEQIKWLAAAEGYEGTHLSFGHHERGALHGRYLVLRRWEGGRSVPADPAAA